MDDTWMMVLIKLRVPHGLPIATILEDYNVGTAHAAWGRPRCPHVMTTTLPRAEVSIMVEDNARTMCQLEARSSRKQRLGKQ